MITLESFKQLPTDEADEVSFPDLCERLELTIEEAVILAHRIQAAQAIAALRQADRHRELH